MSILFKNTSLLISGNRSTSVIAVFSLLELIITGTQDQHFIESIHTSTHILNTMKGMTQFDH